MQYMKKNDCPATGLHGHVIIKYLLIMKLAAILILGFSFQSIAINVSSQDRIDLDLKGTSILNVIKKIEARYSYHFVYNDEVRQNNVLVDVFARNASIDYVMQQLLSKTNYSYKKINNGLVVIIGTESVNTVFRVTGIVTDNTGKPLAGVSIIEKGTTNGTTTGVNGRFSFNVKDNKAVLVVSNIGYETREVIIGNNTELTIELLSIENKMDEVVVIAYGTQRKKDLTGSVASIKSSSTETIPVVSIEQLFKGQVAGVQASVSSGTPGSASNVNIRGIGSITASTQPLYVVDGLPISGQSIETNFTEARTGMDFINPDDIESIEILKDASATSIYGARGANGVILITTKSGKQGKSTVTFSTSFGITTMANKIKMMTTRENQEYWELAKARVGRIEAALDSSLLDVNTDWQKVTSQSALRQNYNIGFQGGNQRLQYYLSFDYLNQQGLLRYTDYNKYSIRGTVSAQVNNKLSVDNRFTITRSQNDGSFTGGQGGTPNTTGATQRSLYAPTYLKPNSKNPGVDEETGQTYIDPLVILRDLSDDITLTNITEQVTLKYNVLKGLQFQTMAGFTYRFFNNDQYQGAAYAATKGDNSKIEATVNTSNTINYINENTLTYKKRFGMHDFTFLLGNTLQQETTSGTNINAVDFPNTVTRTNALQNAKDITVYTYKQQWQLASFFGRFNYTVNNKYLFTATLRKDGSSKLAAGNKWGTFPSLAVGWNISDENFLKNVKWISTFKIRASWGQIGNSEIGTYKTLTVINSGTNGFDNELLPYYYLSSYGDSTLKWEISQQSNLGVDMEFLNGKIGITAEIYNKQTKDLLLNQPTPYSAGYGSYLTNVGSMTNKGFELTINYQAIKKRDFVWTTNFNFSTLRNEVTNVGKVGITGIGQTVDSDYPRYLAKGQSIGNFYLVKTAGVWQLGEEDAAAVYGAVPGDWKFVDQNGDHVIDNTDRVFTGNSIPKYSLGLTNTFRYKKFDFMILATGDFGAQTLNAVKPNLWQARKNGGAAYDLKAWSPTNPTNELAAPSIYYNSEFLHDGYLENGDIVRIQNVRIGYRFNVNRKSKTSLYVYFSGNNVWSWSEYDGYDPEVGNGINKGIDRFNYPRGRIYNFGAQLTL